jgi:hypothetical protein
VVTLAVTTVDPAQAASHSPVAARGTRDSDLRVIGSRWLGHSVQKGGQPSAREAW